MAALTSQADAALAAANPRTPVGGGSLGPDGGLGGMFKRAAGNPNVHINTRTGTLVVLDWDLTVDWRSTPYDVDVFSVQADAPEETYRKRSVAADGYCDFDDYDYYVKMWSILYRLLRARDYGYCDIVIVTRNSVANVEAIIDKAADLEDKWNQMHGQFIGSRISSKQFPIISYPENRVPAFSDRKCKAQLLHEHFPGMEHVDKIVLVDDSHGNKNREHERFEAYGLSDKFDQDIEICHVKVRRCPRGKPYGDQGLGNQTDKLGELASHILGSEEQPKWTWDELIEKQDWTDY